MVIEHTEHTSVDIVDTTEIHVLCLNQISSILSFWIHPSLPSANFTSFHPLMELSVISTLVPSWRTNDVSALSLGDFLTLTDEEVMMALHLFSNIFFCSKAKRLASRKIMKNATAPKNPTFLRLMLSAKRYRSTSTSTRMMLHTATYAQLSTLVALTSE